MENENVDTTIKETNAAVESVREALDGRGSPRPDWVRGTCPQCGKLQNGHLRAAPSTGGCGMVAPHTNLRQRETHIHIEHADTKFRTRRK